MRKYFTLIIFIFSVCIPLFSQNEAFLGVYLEVAISEDLKNAGLKHGLRIERIVPNSPASIAGLQENDIITKLNNKDVFSEELFREFIEDLSPGDKLTLTIYRNRRELVINAILGRRKNYLLNIQNFNIINKRINTIGLRAETINKQLAKFFNVENGLLVMEVFEESSAYRSGIIAGDIIIRADGHLLYDSNQFQHLLNSKNEKDKSIIEINRNGKTKKIEVEIQVTENIIAIDLENAQLNNPFSDISIDRINSWINSIFSDTTKEDIKYQIDRLQHELEKLRESVGK